ncbi:predicted protein [Histoplasma capsulatum var. duboisii H88]|uniref:Predicted protein n=2 Tax=Ajellomyces capsulatus TaxID=5037 RepID=F0UL57_AJEC8|nr:predicted protein [Histoplasma capsulatum H143]EGC46161.1 predicted protein [Histoplasma capsulatum var. duboisii H88]
MRGMALQTAVPGVKRREITEENNRRHLSWRGSDQRLWISIVNRCKYLNHRGMYPVPEHQVALAIIVFIDWSFAPFQPLGGLEKQPVLAVAHSQGCGCTGG